MIQNLFKVSIFTLMLFFISSCGEDTILNQNPTIGFNGNTGAAVTIKAGQSFSASLNASKNDADLNGLEIRENGTKIDPSRINYKGASVGGNPILILGGDKTSFSANDVIIVGPTAVGVYNYDFIIIDQNNNSSKVTKTVTIEEAIPATITFNGSSPIDLGLGSLHLFNFTVAKGSGEVVGLEVREKGVTITDVTRLAFDNVPFVSNPNPLDAAYHGGFTSKNVAVRMPSVAGDYEYTFIFIDNAGARSETKVLAKVGTALTLNLDEVVFNASGGTDFFGALDLDTGKAVPSSSTDSEIQDLGIDVNLPAATNWLQKIKPENGAALRWIDKNLLDANFSFSTISYNEEIANKLWPNGADIVDESPKLAVGNIFAVKKGSTYYAFEVKDIIVTTNNNEDYYIFSIKK